MFCAIATGAIAGWNVKAGMTEPVLVDFHNHVIPGVDDGAVDDVEAAAALTSFLEQGITIIVATPHVQGSLGANEMQQRLGEIDCGWTALRALVHDRFPQLTLHRGAEVMLDTPRPDLSDDRLRLAGGSFVLVEYPYMTVPPNSASVIEAITGGGFTPIIGHPERYSGVTPESPLPAQWRTHGALLQVNAGSLTGRYGPQARENALALLGRGLADYVCSDYHARGRPATRSARRALQELGAHEQADLLMSVNPRRMLAGERPLPVQPVSAQTGLFRRLTQWLG
jgi:protein-tyrosine phosphatase